MAPGVRHHPSILVFLDASGSTIAQCSEPGGHTSSHSVTIGFANGDGVPMHSPFDGLIDEVRVYNGKLSDCEILILANRTC